MQDTATPLPSQPNLVKAAWFETEWAKMSEVKIRDDEFGESSGAFCFHTSQRPNYDAV